MLSELDLCFNSVHLPLNRLWVQMGVWAVMMELLVSWHNLYKAGPDTCSVQKCPGLKDIRQHLSSILRMFVTSFVLLYALILIFKCQFCTCFPSNYGVVLSGSVPFIFLFNLNFEVRKEKESQGYVCDYPWSEFLAQVLFSIYRSALKKKITY